VEVLDLVEDVAGEVGAAVVVVGEDADGVLSLSWGDGECCVGGQCQAGTRI
jgi:hypothetical protein